MRYIDLALPDAARNLAFDEALLDSCEDGRGDEVLRFWESKEYFVVLGISSKIRSETDLDACRRLGVPVLRRSSGGATVLQGPGCLSYALVLRQDRGEAYQSLTRTNLVIMTRQREALQRVLGGKPIHISGHTDLTIQNLKFSGNSQRRKRKFLLFHGTFLLDLDLALVEELLRVPDRQPEYRRLRKHRDFLMNLKIPAEKIRSALKEAWEAKEELKDLPLAETERLAAEKYLKKEWIERF